MRSPANTRFLVNETRAMLNRLQTVQSFSLNTPMVMAAAVSTEAQVEINRHLATIAYDLRHRLLAFVHWVRSPQSQSVSAAEAQARYTLLKLRFNNLLDQIDIFADVLLQRGEHRTGIWMAGLDVLAEDALHLPGDYYQPPPLICFLERGHGAAIRRARTRLPGGDENPVGVIQIPRERMIGSGIASSLIHEVGHQGSELLGLTDSIRAVLGTRIQAGGSHTLAWQLLSRWLNEILSDFWAVAHLGITATYGLISVVSLPSYFVFRIATDAPHPFPWIRVKISLAVGEILFPHPQWERLSQQWEALYPTSDLPPPKRALIQDLQEILPAFAQLIVDHQPDSLRGEKLREVFPVEARQPAQLQALFGRWRTAPDEAARALPSLAFAVIGQAKADGALTAGEEFALLTRLLTQWALRRSQQFGGQKRLPSNGQKVSKQPMIVNH